MNKWHPTSLLSETLSTLFWINQTDYIKLHRMMKIKWRVLFCTLRNKSVPAEPILNFHKAPPFLFSVCHPQTVASAGSLLWMWCQKCGCFKDIWFIFRRLCSPVSAVVFLCYFPLCLCLKPIIPASPSLSSGWEPSVRAAEMIFCQAETTKSFAYLRPSNHHP